jgi:hypothetical protein
MSENIRISLGHPILIFVYSLALLLGGCAIGMHWDQSRTSAIWIAVAAAALMVVHDTFTGFIFASLTLRRFQREQRAGRNSPSSHA